jgi:hypothetical protein
MKKNSGLKKKQGVKPVGKPRSRNNGGASKKNIVSNARSDTRWSFNIDDLGVGPLSLGKLNVNSRSDTVGVAPRSLKVQTVMPRIRTELGGKYGATDILEGSEYLISVNCPDEGGYHPGDLIDGFPLMINPNSFVNTRIHQFAQLYQRYRFKRLAFIYEAISPTTQPGQLIAYGDYDPENVITESDPDNLSIAAAHFGMSNCQVWESQVFPFGVVDDFSTMYTSIENISDGRLVFQGTFNMFAASDITPVTGGGLALGNLYISYEIEFNVPILSNSSLEAVLYSGYFAGDSTSSTFNAPFGLTGGSLIAATDTAYNGELIVGNFDPTNGSFNFDSLPIGIYQLIVSVPIQATTTALIGATIWLTMSPVDTAPPLSSAIVPGFSDYAAWGLNTGAVNNTVTGVYTLNNVVSNASFGYVPVLNTSTGTVTTAIPYAAVFIVCSLGSISPLGVTFRSFKDASLILNKRKRALAARKLGHHHEPVRKDCSNGPISTVDLPLLQTLPIKDNSSEKDFANPCQNVPCNSFTNSSCLGNHPVIDLDCQRVSARSTPPLHQAMVRHN